MTISGFASYVKQLWKNKPDTSTPLSAERLLHIEEGIKGNSDAIEALAAAVVSQIVNDPEKIASMAALYAVNQKAENAIAKIGDTSKLPSGAADVVAAITQQNSNLNTLIKVVSATSPKLSIKANEGRQWYSVDINADIFPPKVSGYTLLGFLNAYANGDVGLIIYPNGWYKNTKNNDISNVTITASWIYIKTLK